MVGEVSIANAPIYVPPAPFPNATAPVEWFHREHLLYRNQFDDPRLIDHILDTMELQLVTDIWKAGYCPAMPQWIMWVERFPFGDGEWEPRVRVTIQGIRRG